MEFDRNEKVMLLIAALLVMAGTWIGAVLATRFAPACSTASGVYYTLYNQKYAEPTVELKRPLIPTVYSAIEAALAAANRRDWITPGTCPPEPLANVCRPTHRFGTVGRKHRPGIGGEAFANDTSPGRL
jgi:hypothetical protein